MTYASTNPRIEEAHLQMVRNLAKPGEEIIKSLTPEKAHLLHMAVGAIGEAGETLDIVKKLVIYNKPMTPEMRKKLVEELGDKEFYLRGIYDVTGISREEVLLANMAKLNVRYAEGTYSDAAAQNRADKDGAQFDPA
jgi:hypothetical protein